MNLTTRYLGLDLANPLVAGAGPLGRELDNIRRLEDLGAGAVVLPSIFEEQIEHEQEVIERLTTAGIDTYGEALTYFPSQSSYAIGPGRYIEMVHRAVRAVDIPVIPSLNSVTPHGWVSYARQLEEAGARAIELNVYFIPAGVDLSATEVERRYLDVLRAVKTAVRIPVAVKLGPYFSAVGHMARQLVDAGADGLVLFNRFYEPDIDLAQLALLPNLELSTRYEIRLPLMWIGILSGRIKASLAASTGVQSAEEVIKYLLAGADVVMTTSALLRHGPDYAATLLAGLSDWLHAKGWESVDQARGLLSVAREADAEMLERAGYLGLLEAARQTYGVH